MNFNPNIEFDNILAKAYTGEESVELKINKQFGGLYE